MIPGAVHFRIVGYTENPPRTFSHGCLLFWESTTQIASCSGRTRMRRSERDWKPRLLLNSSSTLLLTLTSRVSLRSLYSMMRLFGMQSILSWRTERAQKREGHLIAWSRSLENLPWLTLAGSGPLPRGQENGTHRPCWEFSQCVPHSSMACPPPVTSAWLLLKTHCFPGTSHAPSNSY